MIREEITGRCDACDSVIVTGPPERSAEVREEFRKETALAIVGGYSVRICEDCIASGVFNDPNGNHPKLDRDLPPAINPRRRAFPIHPRRNRRIRDDVIDGEVVDGDPSADDYDQGPFNPEYAECRDPECGPGFCHRPAGHSR